MGLLKRIGQVGLGIIGGAIGGPAGAAIGGSLGGALFNGGGGQLVPSPQRLPGIPNIPGIPSPFGGISTPGMTNVPATTNGSGMTQQVTALLGGNAIVTEAQPKVIHSAPPGFVVVDMPDGSGKKAVRKEVARCLGLWKPRKKPPISAADWSKLKTAKRVEAKAKKIADTAGYKCTAKARR